MIELFSASNSLIDWEGIAKTIILEELIDFVQCILIIKIMLKSIIL